MGRIPTLKNQGIKSLGPPRRAGTAPAPWPGYGSMTKDKRAMAGLGEAVVGLGQDISDRILEARVNSEFIEGKALWTSRHDEFIRGLRDEQDYKSIPQNYEKFNTGLQKEVLGLASTQRANTGLKNWMVEESPKQSRQIFTVALQKEQDYQRASTLAAVDTFIKDGNAPSAIATLIRGRNAGYLGAEEVERRSQTVAQEVDFNTGIQLLESDPVEFLEDIEDEDYLENLDAGLRSQLKRRARTQMGLSLHRQREAIEVATNAEQGRLMRLARDGKLTDEVIRTSQLGEFGTGSKNTFYGILDAYADAALKGKEAPFKESNPEVEAKILDLIRDPRSDITPKDISDLVGKGLSIDVADRMINRLDVYKDFWFGRADRFLKDNLGWSDELAKYTFPEGALSYKLAMDDLFDAIETEKLKGRDILNRAAEISVPYIIDYHQNVLLTDPKRLERIRKLLGAKTEPEVKRGRPKKETKTETEKKLDDIWK